MSESLSHRSPRGSVRGGRVEECARCRMGTHKQRSVIHIWLYNFYTTKYWYGILYSAGYYGSGF
jgi:hypothetical protein